jgi:plastocyanin
MLTRRAPPSIDVRNDAGRLPDALEAPDPEPPSQEASMPRATGLTIAALAVAFAGCGSSSSSPSSAPPATSPAPATESGRASRTWLELSADSSGQFKYDKQSLRARAGEVTVTLANTSPVPYDVTVAKANGQVVGATAIFSSGKRSLSLTLSRGTYTFYCSVPGHRAAGMSGTLVVE